MSIEHLTVVTCDRCKREERYERDDWEGASAPDWAVYWPEAVTPAMVTPIFLGAAYEPVVERRPFGVVCADCLTEAERQQLTERRAQEEADRADEIPF
jgi:hypothetical protein